MRGEGLDLKRRPKFMVSEKGGGEIKALGGTIPIKKVTEVNREIIRVTQQ